MLSEDLNFQLEEIDDKLEYLLEQIKQIKNNNCTHSKTIENFSGTNVTKSLGTVAVKSANVAVINVSLNIENVSSNTALTLSLGETQIATTTVNSAGMVVLSGNICGEALGELTLQATSSATVNISNITVFIVGKGIKIE